jgi:glycosyltransferase involved in cell wall biosynthesis
MKVLIIHQHFKTPHTGGALRSYYLATGLLAQGLTPVVITAHALPRYQVQQVEGVEVHYLPVAYHNYFPFYRRLWAFARFVGKATWLAWRLPKPALVYAISVPPTVAIPALLIKWFKKVPFVFEVGDLWPEAPIQLGFIQNRLAKKLLYAMEKFLYRQAACLIALSNGIRDYIEKKAPGTRVEVIPNMADVAFFQPATRPTTATLRIAYIGTLGIANGLHHLLQAAAASQHAQLPVHFTLCGEGAMQETLRQQAASLELSNLTFEPFRNREGARGLLQESDAVWVSFLPAPVLQTGSPNKYFDGLAAGKLIIINFGGDIKTEIETQQCGVYVDPHQPENFVKVIQPFLGHAAALNSYQQAARYLAEKKYPREKLVGQCAAVLKEVALRQRMQ